MVPRNDVVSVAEVAHILTIIAAPPNRRSTPVPGDQSDRFHEWFDGGGLSYITGGATTFVFGDGLEVAVWRMFGLVIRIRWPDGRTVELTQTTAS